MTSNNVSTCASEVQIDHLSSWNYRISAACALSCIIATFIISVIALKSIYKKSTFQSSTRIILFFNIIYANLHQLIYAILSIDMVYKGIFLVDQPCEWLVTEADCLPYTVLLYTGIGGMIYSQTGILIERAFSTFHPEYTTNLSRKVGVFISTLVLLLSTFTYRIILWDDPLDGAILTCFIPAVHSAHRANWFLFIAFLLTFFNLITSIAVMYYNKRLEYSIRYKVRERFKKREAIDSTHTICIVSMSQFLTMLIYSLGVLLLRCNQQNMLLSTFFDLISWVYTVPYSALLLPLILIFRIRATKVNRTKKIQDITNVKQTQIEHINQITSMWNVK